MTAEDVKTLAEWLGEGGKAVSSDEAERRASICETCPMNMASLSVFRMAMGAVRKWVESRNQMGLKTSKEGKLGVCRGCGCWLPLKVHVEYVFIKQHQRQEVADKIRTAKPDCWQL